METTINLIIIGIFALFLTIGFLSGVIRGLKRSILHIVFVIVSMVLAVLLTKTITNAILAIRIPINGKTLTISEYIISLIESNFDISNFKTVTDFVEQLPFTVASPIVFMLIQVVASIFFNIVYAIVARCSFGKKKEDLKNHKAYRAYGGVLGLVEGMISLILVFAPITALTKTASDILYNSQENLNAKEVVVLNESSNDNLQTIGEMAQQNLPKEVELVLKTYNKSVVGRVSSVAGIDNAMFDYLADFYLDGEKISFRKEVKSLTQTYDSFTVVYNALKNNNFDISIDEFVSNLKIVTESGIFKKVVAETVRDVVVNYDSLKEDFNISLPKDAENIISNLKNSFSKPGFNAYEYLKHDIDLISDTAQDIFKEKIVQEATNLKDSGIETILNFVNKNTETLRQNTKNIISLNIFGDTFEIFIDMVSDKFAELIKNEEKLEISLNGKVADKEELVETTYKIANNLKEINDEIKISELASENAIKNLSKTKNLEVVLNKIGNTLDTARNFELFVLPETDDRVEKVYVLDNVLKCFDVDILGDDVILNDTNKTISTYKEFVDFIKQPILKAKNIGLMDMLDSGDFDTILDKILEELKENENILSEVIMPFYQLDKTSFGGKTLREMVFDNIVEELKNNVSILNIEGVKTENSYDTWNSELAYVGKVINALNKGNINGKTYLKYVLTDGYDAKILMENMLDDGNLPTVLEPIFSAKVFENLTSTLFETVDTTISDFTKQPVTSDLSNLKETKEETIATIETLLNITLKKTTIEMSDVGDILDALKENAYNTGAKNGVFKNAFVNIIWYATGDDITQTTYTGIPQNDFYDDVKAYLNVSDVENGYYTYTSYKEAVAEIQKAVDLADKIDEKTNGLSLTSNTESYVTAIKESVEELNLTESEAVEIVNDLKQLLDNKGESFVEETLTAEEKTVAEEKIDSVFATQPGLATALKELIGIEVTV